MIRALVVVLSLAEAIRARAEARALRRATRAAIARALIAERMADACASAIASTHCEQCGSAVLRALAALKDARHKVNAPGGEA